MSVLIKFNEYTEPKVLVEAKGIPIVVKELVPLIVNELKKI